ncbi:platelet glycoprotein Ib alpha chain-like [Gracilinanus agilis]|uniref:platelet glycoprotein Ib alpha chain-like n=1 Tax=Gracilinanus agilis TaxID=191870 RepID=UPI001CFD525C|nr:platelet glycoprotein Ib alpha chain-like [Gracilinanus agilis]
MKVLFLIGHILLAMVCLSTAELDWAKWPCEKQNERSAELKQQPLRQPPIQNVYTRYTRQLYVPVFYPPKTSIQYPYFSKLAWQRPYSAYIPLLSTIHPWALVPSNPQPSFPLNPPQYAQVPPPSSPTSSPTAPAETTTIPITDTAAATVAPEATPKLVTTEESTTATIPTSPAPAQQP